MRYIGSKVKLLSELEKFITSKIDYTEKKPVFFDVFSGTGSVSLYLKRHYQIVTNDLMSYAYHIANGHVITNFTPTFKGILSELNGSDVLDYLNTLPSKTGFIAEQYSCKDDELGTEQARSFFTAKNAQKIDSIRHKIQIWKNKHLISDSEESYLIGCLIEAVTKISNTTGTYGAFLKFWEKRALSDLELTHPILFNNECENTAIQGKAEDVVKDIVANICYIDPPYNSRQYATYYHLLETIAKYDNPEIKGKTGVRIDSSKKTSVFSSKSKAKQAFKELLSHVQAKHIFISYNSDGIISKQDLEELIKSIGIIETYDCKVINYNSYQSKIVKKRQVEEYIFYIEKENSKDVNFCKN